MTGIAAKRCPSNTSTTAAHRPPATTAICSSTRTTFRHGDERAFRMMRYAAYAASTVITAAVYTPGAVVANHHSGHTIIIPDKMHTITSTVNFPADANCFLIKDLIFFAILKITKSSRFSVLTETCCPKTETAYSSAIAEVGHSLAHVPQLIHLSASILRALSSSAIAPTGQSGSQVPQFMHLALSIL